MFWRPNQVFREKKRASNGVGGFANGISFHSFRDMILCQQNNELVRQIWKDLFRLRSVYVGS